MFLGRRAGAGLAQQPLTADAERFEQRPRHRVERTRREAGERQRGCLVEVLDGSIALDHDHPGTGALVRITVPVR